MGFAVIGAAAGVAVGAASCAAVRAGRGPSLAAAALALGEALGTAAALVLGEALGTVAALALAAALGTSATLAAADGDVAGMVAGSALAAGLGDAVILTTRVPRPTPPTRATSTAGNTSARMRAVRLDGAAGAATAAETVGAANAFGVAGDACAAPLDSIGGRAPYGSCCEGIGGRASC